MSRDQAFDIRASADEVVRLAQQGQMLEALQRLEQRRAAQPPAIQEALDRYGRSDQRTLILGFQHQRAGPASI